MKKTDKIQKVYPLTPMQEGMLFHTIMDPESNAYHNLLDVELRGTVDPVLFEQSFNQLIAEYDILRTAFVHQKLARPRQVVLKERKAPVYFKTLLHLPEAEQKRIIDAYIREQQNERFDLAKDVLIRIAIFQISEQAYRLIWFHHHILLDGWGLGIIINKLFQTYADLKQGKPLTQEAIVPYSDYIKWLENQDKQEAIAYWSRYLNGYEQLASLPKTGLSADSGGRYDKQELSFIIDEPATRELNRIASRERTTMNTVIQAVWGILLGKYNNSQDVIFGSVVSGRPSEIAGIEKMVGLFINTIPVRISYQGDYSFTRLLAEVQRNALASKGFDYVPLYDIQSQTELKQSMIDHLIIFENYPVAKELQNNNWEQSLGFSINRVNIEEETNYPLNIVVAPGDELIVKLSYNAAVYQPEFIGRIEGHLKAIIAQAVADPEVLLKDIRIVTGKEERQILDSFQNNKGRYPEAGLLHALFEEQAAQTPEQTAAVCGNRQISYAELNSRANRLARTLRDRGVGPDYIVAVMTERSLDMLVAILAVLKAGGAYLPLDPGYPPERIRYLLADSGTGLVLSKLRLIGKADISAAQWLDLEDEASYAADDANPEPSAAPSDLAYIIYTSGTTGLPKGVMIEHRSIAGNIRWRAEEYGLDASDTVLQLFSFSFDGFVTSFFTPLVSGSTVVLADDDEAKDPLAIRKLIDGAGVTHFIAVPSLYGAILETLKPEHVRRLRIVTLAGERIPESLVRASKELHPHIELINEYGPTENSVISTCSRSLQPDRPITIGRPIATTQVYIVDRHHQLQPVGVAGELCVAGTGLARGYWGREELTADKFVENPFIPGGKMYKTGDMAKWTPDGEIAFLDRADFQVKIRGYRIEPGEIEAALRKYPLVKEAVIVVVEDSSGQKWLAAYYTSVTSDTSDGQAKEADVRRFLERELPYYMVPSYVLRLEQFPLTPNGKIDRGALPKPLGEDATGSEYAAPATLTEANLTLLWQDVLKADRLGVNDHFFERGGHSLKAMILVSRIHSELNVEVPVKALFDYPTIRQLARYLEGADEGSHRSIERVEKRDHYPVSSSQKRMFVLHRLDRDGTSNNMAGALAIDGPLDAERLRKVFRDLVKRHETLRTSFDTVDGETVQIVHEQQDVSIEVKEASGERTEELLIHGFVRPFALNAAPLVRMELIRLAEERHILLFDMHHIISDGTSMGILIHDFIRLYQGESLPEPALQYKDFAVWQQGWLESDAKRRQEAYWLNSFAGDIPVLDLPADYPRPPVQSFEGEKIVAGTGKALKDELLKLAADTGTTLFMVLLAAYNVLLAKYSAKEDIVVGTPIAGRPHADLQPIIGVFVNSLALRNRPESGLRFADFLSEVKRNLLDAYDNQDYPFELLIEKLDVQRDMSRNPLFDTMFVLQNIELETVELDGLSISPYQLDNPVAKFDLMIEAREEEAEIEFCFVYRTKLFRKETAQRLAGHFLNILRAVVSDPYQTLSSIDILSPAETQQLLVEFNDTAARYPQEMTLHALFEQQALLWPDRTAVVFGGERITYRELNERANKLARVLRSHGVQPDGMVGLLLERSLDMIVGILATLKAGGVYVPLDPDYPQDRLQFMVDDCGARVLLTKQHLSDSVPLFAGSVLDIADTALYSGDGANLEPVNRPSDLAYIIYTSGTTGKPKGVMIEHRNVVRLLINDKTAYDFSERDVWTVFHSFCFDFSVWEMYGALLFGGTSVVVPKAVAQNPREFAQLLRQEGVTVLNQTPTAFYALIREELEQPNNDLSVRYVIFGGEALSPVMLTPWKAKYPKTKLINMYGITETTVHVTYKEITESDMETSLSNIGRPIPTLTGYIFDAEKRLVPIGVAGELYVGGEGVARGYLNRGELTAERFVANPYNPQERLYRSGDLARLLPNGEMEYLGRIDHQVKIRGHRIELGEIETQLLKHEAIREAVVLALDDEQGQKFLCAYVLSDRELTVSELRAHTSADLPLYMIPAHFVRLERMPLTANGKVDRKALPKPEGGLRPDSEYVAPRNELESELAGIWQDVLGTEQVGIRDNFFELGGDSIKAIQVSARLFKLGLQLDMKDLFRYPVIEDLSGFITAANRRSSQETVAGDILLTPIQHWFFAQRFADQHHWNQSVMLHHADGFDSLALEKALGQLVLHHDVLRAVFHELDGRITQFNRGLEGGSYEYQRFDFTGEPDAEERIVAEANRIQRSIELSDGPLLKAAQFKTVKGDHLLLVAHHLIVDGISWRIIFEDLATGYAQAVQGDNISLQEKTDSFQYWSERLSAYAQSKELLQEIDYWKRVESMPLDPLYKDFAVETCTIGESETIELTLAKEETEHLLKNVHHAYHTEVNDILLAALGLAVQEWGQVSRVCVQLEGHGREEIVEDVNISRTVGWFTSQFPVVFDFKQGEDLSAAIKSVKETLRRVPNKGLGYDILKYVTAEGNRAGLQFNLKPEICFNYLGQFDSDLAHNAFGPSSLDMGDPISPNSHRTYPIIINGMVTNGRLGFNISYSPRQYEEATLQRFADLFNQALLRMIDHCVNKEEGERTASDFSSKELTGEDVDDIFQMLGDKLG